MNPENTTLQLSLPNERNWKTALRILPIESIPREEVSPQLLLNLTYPIGTNPDEIITKLEAMKSELESLGCRVEIKGGR